jgi:nucleoside-diphosphate-sugar epimerase
VPHSLSSIEAARLHLQFAPQVDLDSGLGRTLEWYRRSAGLPTQKEL